MRHRPICSTALFLALLVSAAHAEPVPVTDCGQTITEGVLVGDLDCASASGFAITIEHRGSLDLAGYRLTGTADCSLDWRNPIYGGGVHCLGECTVKGGAIAGPSGVPEGASYSIGIYADPLMSRSRLRLENVTISGWSTYGVLTGSAEVVDSLFEHNYYGIVVDRSMAMHGCTLMHNIVEGAHFGSGKISDSTLDANGAGLYVLRTLRMVGSSASNNEGLGIFGGRKINLQSSSIDNNCLDATTGCADVVARRRPHLVGTTCGTSLNDLTDSYWNVCSQD